MLRLKGCGEAGPQRNEQTLAKPKITLLPNGQTRQSHSLSERSKHGPTLFLYVVRLSWTPSAACEGLHCRLTEGDTSADDLRPRGGLHG